MKYYDLLVNALPDVKRRGYMANFEVQPDHLFCRDLNLCLGPEAFKVDELYRFEKNVRSDRTIILYLISTAVGVKGFLLDAYGVFAENISFEMAKKLRLHYVW